MHRRFKWTAIIVFAVIVLVLLLDSGRGRAFRLPAGTGPAKVALGDSHGVILAPDGSLWVWGENSLGWPVLGLGSVECQPSLKRLGTNSNWVDVAADGAHTLALKSDGTIWGWGENLNWQLGDGTRVTRPTPVRSVPGNDWKQIAAGLHGLALRKDGSLWAWGNNWSGALGIGVSNSSAVPVQVGTSTNWVKAWANNVESVGLQSDGSLWDWGYQVLRFGLPATNRLAPVRLSPDTNWVDVGLGDFMGFAIKSDGTLWAWGADADVYTGARDPALNDTPRQVGTNRDWKACSPFWNCCMLVMKRDGSLWAVDDVLDQRGKRLGNPGWRMQPVVVRRIGLEKDIVAFAGGRRRLGVAVTREGEVWTWGIALGEHSAREKAQMVIARLFANLGYRPPWRGVSRDFASHEAPWQLPADQ